MKSGAVILVVDDEPQIRRFLKISLETHNYKVVEAETGSEGLQNIKAYRPDLVILDLSLPDIDGYDFLKEMRNWSSTPVIILTVKDSEDDKIRLLDAGADDYLTKPFGVGELLARIRTAIRHSQKESDELIIKIRNITIDIDKRIVKKNNEEIKLTPTEYSLLTLLAKYAGKVITQNQIMKELWGPNLTEETQYLRIYVLQLRKKIEDDPSNPEIIITEPGVGYRLLKD